MMSLLEKGCPCVKKECPRFGNCEACIKNHVENPVAKYPVYCMREKAKACYQKQAATV